MPISGNAESTGGAQGGVGDWLLESEGHPALKRWERKSSRRRNHRNRRFVQGVACGYMMLDIIDPQREARNPRRLDQRRLWDQRHKRGLECHVKEL